MVFGFLALRRKPTASPATANRSAGQPAKTFRTTGPQQGLQDRAAAMETPYAYATLLLVGVGAVPEVSALADLRCWLRDVALLPDSVLNQLDLANGAAGQNPWAIQVPVRTDAGKMENQQGGNSGCLTVHLIDAPVLQLPLQLRMHHYHHSSRKRQRSSGSAADVAEAAATTRAAVVLTSTLLLDRPVPQGSSKVTLQMANQLLNATQRAVVSEALNRLIAEKSDAGRLHELKARRVWWTVLRDRFDGFVADFRASSAPSTTVRLTALQRHRDPHAICADDPCQQRLKFPIWLHTACPQESGMLLLQPETPLCRSNYLTALLHAMKNQLLYDALAGTIHEAAILRGMVAEAAADCFWAAADFFTADARGGRQQEAQAEEVGESTWKNSVVWIGSTPALGRLISQAHDASPQDLWAAGTLHVLESAPRTWVGRGRLRFAPPLDSVCCGDSLMIVLCFAGPDRWAYTTLQRAAPTPFCRVRCGSSWAKFAGQLPTAPQGSLRAMSPCQTLTWRCARRCSSSCWGGTAWRTCSRGISWTSWMTSSSKRSVACAGALPTSTS